jgi:hypothetical protein
MVGSKSNHCRSPPFVRARPAADYSDGFDLDVNTSAGGYISTPSYRTTLGGYANHWLMTGVNNGPIH